jgi:hypothetical protein
VVDRPRDPVGNRDARSGDPLDDGSHGRET